MINFKTPSFRIILIIILFPLIPLFFYGISSHIFFVKTQDNIIIQDIKRTKDSLINIEKNNLKEKTNNFAQILEYHENEIVKNSTIRAKEIIYLTALVINNIYKINKGKISEKKLKRIIIETLENIRSNKGLNYIFLLDLKGNVLVHKDNSIVNTNVINLIDKKGTYFIKNFLDIIHKKNEGFSSYYWNDYIKNSDIESQKTTFIKKLAAYDWFIGTGSHTETISLNCRDKLLRNIQNNISFENGYIYITNSKNETILPPIDDLSHLPPQKVEGFQKNKNHISYTIYIDKFDWYIIAIKELQVIKNNLSIKKEETENAISNEITMTLSLISLSWFLSLFISIYLSSYIFRKLKRYETEISNTHKKLIFQSRQATIGELLPMIAHQWRQPINKIASIIAVIRFRLLDKKINGEDIDRQCQAIEDNIEFMSETIDNFRTFYEPKEHKKQENLKQLIEKSLVLLDELINTKGIIVITELDEVTMELYGNEFMQVMINLIENSIDACPKNNGRILICLVKEKMGQVTITIEDNGTGIELPLISKIFDPYFSTKKGSMGLGLHMSKIIVEKHLKGHIHVENTSIGICFTITL